jgi:hypothetical protein
MEKQLALTTPPQESLHALERAVAQRFNWRILTGGKVDQPRFVIEKQVSYNFVRGWSTYALYQVVGSFQKTDSGETTLHYVVTGQSAVPIFHAVFNACLLLVIGILPGSFIASPTTAGKLIGILLFGILLFAIIAYGRYAYHSYQGHLVELNRFMAEFAQQRGQKGA